MMEAILDALLEPWTHAYFVKAVLGGSIIAVSCAVLGCYVILRKMAFIGDAMSHALLPGVGIGYLVMNAIVPGGFTAGGLLLGALVAAVLTSVSISALSQVSRLSEDTAIGIVYTGLFAAGIVILTRFQQYINIDLNHFFQGDIYGVSWEDMWLSASVGAIVLSGIVMFYRHFTIVSFDPTMAASIGLPTRLIHMALTGMIALVCVAGISMVGVIMIVGLLITPPALAYMLTDRLPRMMLLSAAIAILSVVAGLYFSEWVNASGGGAIMFTGFVLFLVGLVFAPRYGLLAGWLRRRLIVPQTDIEDILKAGLIGRLLSDLQVPRTRVRRALAQLKREGMLTDIAGDRVSLSEVGQREAAHILRSHQLWEGHFIQRGMDPDQAHMAAEKLEHLHDRVVLDHFDDELDHPSVDRSGLPVPGEQEARLDRAPRLRLSLLREGDRASVMQSLPTVPELPEGTAFMVGARDPETGAWSVTLADGSIANLGHPEADQLCVQRVD